MIVEGDLAKGRRLDSWSFPEIDRAVVSVAIRMAWQMIKVSGQVDVATEGEVRLNRALWHRLNQLQSGTEGETIGFTRRRFETVHRGSEHESDDEEHDEERPDLTFSISGPLPVSVDPSDFGFFVECKPIDARHSTNNYCSTGLARFVDGLYARFMAEAMMVAYVRNEATIAAKLTPHLRKHLKRYQVRQLPAMPISNDSSLATSRHGRIIRRQRSEIAIDHVWLDAQPISPRGTTKKG